MPKGDLYRYNDYIPIKLVSLMNEDGLSAKSYRSISPTALLCTQTRAKLMDLPFASNMYNLIAKSEVQKKVNACILNFVLTCHKSKIQLSTLEGRHLALSEAIAPYRDYVNLELSAGFSTRGLEFSDRLYIETDLPENARIKGELVNKIKGATENHLVLPLNPLNKSELFSFAQKYIPKDKELIVFNEGLLMYLKESEKNKLRNNISALLKKFSPKGYWFTTDFSSRPIDTDIVLYRIMQKIEGITGRKFDRFNCDEEVHEFLRKGDLKGEPLPNIHLAERLSCRKRLAITVNEAQEVADNYRVWKISLR